MINIRICSDDKCLVIIQYCCKNECHQENTCLKDDEFIFEFNSPRNEVTIHCSLKIATNLIMYSNEMVDFSFEYRLVQVVVNKFKGDYINPVIVLFKTS